MLVSCAYIKRRAECISSVHILAVLGYAGLDVYMVVALNVKHARLVKVLELCDRSLGAWFQPEKELEPN